MHEKPDPAISRIFLLAVGCILVLSLPSAAVPAGNHWMEAIGGSVRLSQMTIPGTHDSGAMVEGPLPGTAKCQNATIAEQLGYGVRFLDIRCKHENDAFLIYHGSVNQNLTFTQVMDQVTGFLNANPSECVIISIKEEGASSGTTQSFEATFDSYVAVNPAKWALGTSVPALSGVRGKIQLVRRFGATVSKGINATNWPDNTTFLVNNLSVQDRYQVPDNTEKWNAITAALSAAFSATNADVLHLNFTSGYKPGLFGIPNITTVSNTINPQLATFFGTAPRGKYGCVVMDFADATRPALIYNTNFIAPVFTTTPLSRPAVLKNTSYAATLAGSATDANPGDTLSYRKIAGPAWLNVADNGSLSGTPGSTDTGSNTFTIRVTDNAGLFVETTLSLIVADTNAYWDRDGSTSGAGSSTPTGTWDATSPWNIAANGDGSTINWLAGQSAVFAAGSNATGTYTVTIAGTQDISGLAFQEGTVTLTGGTALRLVANSTVDVSPGLTATVGTPISQDATPRSLSKSGTGTLKLSGTNTYGGATTISIGTLVLGANHVLPNSTAVSIGNATLDAATFTDSVGTLNATGSAVIHLGTGAALEFATGSPAWTGTLALSGTFVSVTSLKFGITSSGLTPAQLVKISAPGWASFSLNASGYLTATPAGPGYASWASAHAPTGTVADDYDGDGVSNGVEHVLGGTKDSNDISKLPKIAISGDHVIFTFERDQASIHAATRVVIDVGTNLTVWPEPGAFAVPDGAATADPGVSILKNIPAPGKDTVILSIPRDPDQTKFARLKVTTNG